MRTFTDIEYIQKLSDEIEKLTEIKMNKVLEISAISTKIESVKKELEYMTEQDNLMN
tara:strand:+ start:1481 stop:1651 length:171 start_codon:yes stop_codon:yes gene_type:complete